MVKSRASNSFSAQLKDFVGPIDFGSPSDPMVIAEAPKTVLGCKDESGIPITARFDNPDSKTSDYYFLWFKDQDTLHAISGYDSTIIYATAPGWYKVEIRAQDYCSSFVSADSIQIFEIKVIPPAPVIPQVAICPEETGGYLSANNPGTGLSVVWFDAMSGGNALDTSLIFVPPSLDTDYYAETLNLITGCRSASRTAARLTVRTGPTITVCEVGKTCVGQKDGSIAINTTGSGLVYDWSHGASTEDLTGLAEGQYFLKITDENGCTDTALVEVPANPEINLSPTVTEVLCKGGTTGSINLGASGGTGTLSYSWSPNTSDNSEIVSNLSAGTYSVTVTDAEGCQVSRNIRVGEPNSALSGTAVASDVSCNGGSNGAVEVFPTGGTPGYTYTWSDGSITTKDRVGLSQGMVTVTITDANNCTHDITATVDEPTLLSAVLSPDSVSCYGGVDGAISSMVSGGTQPYAYSWSNGKTTTGLSNLSAGSDTLTLIDANGCTVIKDTTVGQPASALTIALASGSAPDSVSCYGGADGAIDLSVSGGTPAYSYNWSNGSSAEDLSGLSAGGYSVEVTDAKLCTAVKSFVVSQPAPLLLSATVQDAACPATADGSIDLTVNGGQAPYTFSWSATEGSNNSAFGDVQPRSKEVMVLQVDDLSLKAGQEYRIPIAGDLNNVDGYQFALRANGIEWLGIGEGIAKAEHFGLRYAEDGIVLTSWTKEESQRNEGDPLFELVIRATADISLSEALSIDHQYLTPEAYNTSGEAMNVVLSFAEGINIEAGSFELKQNTPNPFREETVIGFNLAEASEATLTINDVTGRVLKVIKGDFTKGANQISIDSKELPARGVFYYTLTAGEHVATKKMILLE